MTFIQWKAGYNDSMQTSPTTPVQPDVFIPYTSSQLGQCT